MRHAIGIIGIALACVGACAVLSSQTIDMTPRSIFHLIGISAAPSIALGAGAGTAATFTQSGTDLGGEVCVTTAGAPSASATLLTATWALTYTAKPFVILYPSNANAAAVSGAAALYYDRANSSTSAGVIKTGTIGLTTATVYCYNYGVLQ